MCYFLPDSLVYLLGYFPVLIFYNEVTEVSIKFRTTSVSSADGATIGRHPMQLPNVLEACLENLEVPQTLFICSYVLGALSSSRKF